MERYNERILLANVIGECIKSLELDKGINQQELAQRSGIPLRSLRRIERGEVSVNVYSLRQVVFALGEEMTEFWRIVEKNMDVMGEEFPKVRRRLADKVLRDRDNKMDFIRRK
nr:helix-turn-helix transcriptional regulator [Phascolarctobacterium succinatutens]